MKRNLNNRGFTLVELIGVIIILSIVTTIVVVSANKIVDDAQEKSDNVTKENIKTAAIDYMTESEYNNTSTSLFIQSLVESGAPEQIIVIASNQNAFYVKVSKLEKDGFIRLKDNKYDEYCVTIQISAEEENNGAIESTVLEPCTDVESKFNCGKIQGDGAICDANQDGIINYNDAIEILAINAETSTYTEQEIQDKIAIFDANSDETVNTADAVYILRYLYFLNNKQMPD